MPHTATDPGATTNIAIPGKRMLPNFLVIGAAKAGTTAMWHYLRQHPEVYMSPHKEPRYFALCGQPVNFHGPGDKTKFNFVTELTDYQRLFAKAKEEKAVGEASPWYLYVKSAAPAIKETLPDVKLVAILRDPVDRAFSNYLHSVGEGVEPLSTFREAMEAEETRIRENWSPRFHYKSKGFYFQQLQHYLQFFDRKQLKIYLYEDLENEPEALFADLFDYLGVNPLFTVNYGNRHNESRAARSRTIKQVLENDNIIRRCTRSAVPKRWRKTIRKNISALNLKPKPKLSTKDRKDFIELYRDDIEKLEQLIDCDLSRWVT